MILMKVFLKHFMQLEVDQVGRMAVLLLQMALLLPRVKSINPTRIAGAALFLKIQKRMELYTEIRHYHRNLPLKIARIF